MKIIYHVFEITLIFLFTSIVCNAADLIIKNNVPDKVLTFGNSKIMLTLDYNEKCNISELRVNGQTVISGAERDFF